MTAIIPSNTSKTSNAIISSAQKEIPPSLKKLNLMKFISSLEVSLDLFSSYLSTKDISQLLPALPKELYNSLIQPKLTKKDTGLRNAGFIEDSKVNIREAISSIISKGGLPLTPFQKELIDSLEEKIKGLKSVERGGERKILAELVIQYLFTLEDKNIASILDDYGSLSYFFRKKDFILIQRLLFPTPSLESSPEAKKEASQSSVQNPDLPLLNAASLSLERQGRYHEQLALNQKIHQTFIDSSPDSFDDKLSLILLGRRDRALKNHQTLHDFVEEFETKYGLTVSNQMKEMLRLLSENAVEDALKHLSDFNRDNLFMESLTKACIRTSRLDLAFKIAEKIQHDYPKHEFCKEFINAQAFDLAFKMAEKIEDDFLKLLVCDKFIEAKAFDLAFKLAQKVQDKSLDHSVCQRYIKVGAFDLAFKIFERNQFSDDDKFLIGFYFSKAGAIDFTFKIAEEVQSRSKLNFLCIYILKAVGFDLALEFAQRTRNKKVRENFLFLFVMFGGIKQAFELEKKHFILTTYLILAYIVKCGICLSLDYGVTSFKNYLEDKMTHFP